MVFAIDVSGSMAVSTEVQGTPKLTQAQKKEIEDLRAFCDDGSDQNYGTRPGFYHASRLQFLQAAVDTELDKLQRDCPEARASLVTFGDEVIVHGDGRGDPVPVRGDRLSDLEALRSAGEAVAAAQPIKDSRDRIGTRLSNLREGGQTALGPALAVSLAMARSLPGSKIIIATDGLANRGVGKLDGGEDDSFYRALGEEARASGVAINVFSVKGENSRLEFLGICADMTGGRVTTADPAEMDFSGAVDEKIIATGVVLEIFLHESLALRGAERKTRREIGNVTTSSSVSLEFNVRPDYDTSQLTEMPFQVQVRYTRLDGAVCLRVLTEAVPVTGSRAVAEEAANVGVLGINAVQQSAKLASRGKYERAQQWSHSHDHLMRRIVKSSSATPQSREVMDQYANFVATSAPLVTGLNQAMEEEEECNLRFESDEDRDSANSSEERESRRYKSRKSVRRDGLSETVFANKKMSFKKH